MKKKVLPAAAMTLALLLSVNAYAYDNGDFQIWHTEDQEINIFKSTKYQMEEEFRYGGDAHQLYYHHYDFGAAYEICKNFVIGAYYRQIYELKKKKFQEEYRPHIDGTIKWDMYGFAFEDRNRFEYRAFRYQKDFMQYRNKLTVKLPWKFTQFEIRPYVSDEVFANLKEAYLSRNRFYAGLGYSLNKNLKGEIYYMLQSTKSAGNWTNANVLGFKLKLMF